MTDYKLTIYADPTGPVGHFFVGVEGPGINVPISGKYSNDHTLKGGSAALITGGQGEILLHPPKERT